MIVNAAPNIDRRSTVKLLMIGISSLVLCMSYILSLLAPFPLAMSSVLYGRGKTLLVILAMSALIFMIMSAGGVTDPTLLIIYGFCALMGLSLGEVILRNINPVRGVVSIGLGIILMLSVLLAAFTYSSEVTVKQALVSEFEKIQPTLDEQRKKIQASGGAENTTELEALLGSPDLLAEEIIRSMPAFILMSIFIMLWINMFFALKISRFIRLGITPTLQQQGNFYTEQDLLKFKMPDFAIWIVIGFLGVYLGGEYLGGYWEDVGLTGLKVIGVFYFFHGFGIYLAYLDKHQVYGFFRSLLVVFTVATISWLIALLGVIDVFVDFRKLMNKKNEGE